jgi:hypothetical protein
MARIAGVGTLTASADTTVDSTAQDRSIRVRVYNADTVAHTYTFKIGTTALKKVTLASGEDASFGPEHIASGTSLVVNVAEATTTTASNYGKTGEYDA